MPRRPAGQPGAPGGKWYATPNAKRNRKKYHFTLSDETNAAIDRLAGAGKRSDAVECAVMEKVARLEAANEAPLEAAEEEAKP